MSRHQSSAATTGPTSWSTSIPPAGGDVPDIIKRRVRSTAALVLAFVFAVLLSGCTTQNANPAATTAQRAVAVQDVQAHTEDWARLVWAAQKFRAAVETAHKDTQSYAFGDTPKEVIDAVDFRSPSAILTEYEADTDSIRFCFTNRTGEFYATNATEVTSKKPKTTIVIGLGSCDYTKGAVYAGPDGGIAGKKVLDKIDQSYQSLIKGDISEYVPFTETVDAKGRLLPKVAFYTAALLAERERETGRRPVKVNDKILAKWKVRYPKNVTFAYYDNRGTYGYRFCVTDTKNEAIYEASPQRETIIRYTAGNCFAQ